MSGYPLVRLLGSASRYEVKTAVLAALVAVELLVVPLANLTHAEVEPNLQFGNAESTTTLSAVLTAWPQILALRAKPQTPPGTVTWTRMARITAYTSSPEETDDTPFITASGKYVRDGIVAANFLPMGTRIKIPALYGDRIFVVEDRMHPKMVNGVDIWMNTKTEAFRFGVRHAEIAILD